MNINTTSYLESIIRLRGKYVVISGALGNIGRVFARTFAELGANLILIDRHASKFGEDFILSLRGMGVEADFISSDLEFADSRTKAITTIKEKYEVIDVLVNNAAFVGDAALSGWAVPLAEQSIETWNRAFEVNSTAVFHLTKELSKSMAYSESPSIVNIGSIYGQLAPNWSLYDDLEMGNPAAYGASKAAIIQLTRWLATTLAPKIRVNSISPGGVFRNQPDKFVSRYKAETPLGRMATEGDLRGAVIYLSSGMSEYVTGHNLLVDGGWSIK